MKLSARNQFHGIIAKINEGAVNGIVTLDVNGTPVQSTISMNAIHELGLQTGKPAYAVIKATEVMVGIGKHLPLSARNQFPGVIIGIEKGAVNSHPLVTQVREPLMRFAPLALGTTSRALGS